MVWRLAEDAAAWKIRGDKPVPWTRTEPPSPVELEALFPPAAWQAGEDYVGLDRVPTRLVAGGVLAGAVNGQRADYWVRLGPDAITCSSCRRPCRHAAGLAVAFVRFPGTFVDAVDLVDRYLRHGTPDVLVEGLLGGDVLESLETFTEGVFIPPFDEARDLARLGHVDARERHQAISRLVHQRRWTLLARALAAPIDLDPAMIARIYLQEPIPPKSPLLTWLAAHASGADLDAVLDFIVGIVHLDRAGAADILRRSVHLLSAMPGGPEVLPGVLDALQAGEDVLDAAVGILVAVGRPRLAIGLVDRALLTARDERRRRFLASGIAIAEREGSPREPVWRLDALRSGDASQLAILRRRFPALLQAEADALVFGDTAIDDPHLRALTALAAHRPAAAVAAASKAPLPAKTLSRIIRQATMSGARVDGIRLDHLGQGDRSRLMGLILKAGDGAPSHRMSQRED